MPKHFYTRERDESNGLEMDSVLSIYLILDAGCVLSTLPVLTHLILDHPWGEIYAYSHEADEEIEG